MKETKEILRDWKEKGGFETYQELAKFIGVSFKTLDTWKNRGAIPAKYMLKYDLLENGESLDFKELVEELKFFYEVKSLEAVAEKMGYSPNTATAWRRNKALSAQAFLKYQEDKTIAKDAPPAPKDAIKVRYYPNIHALANYSITPLDSEYKIIELEYSLINEAKVSNTNNLDFLKIEGNFMLPYIKSGERVLVEREISPKNGDVVIAMIGDNLYVRRFLTHPLGHWVKLTSENEHYPDIELNDQEVNDLKVVGVVRMIMRLV